MSRPFGTKYIAVAQMGELFEGYFKHVKSKPFKVKDWVGKDGIEVHREKEKPLTMVGFECFVYSQGFNCELRQYFSNRDKAYDDYVPICSHILNRIKQDQIEGGMAGMYNPSITQRLNGLTEKIEQTNVEQPFFNDIPKCDLPDDETKATTHI